MRKTYKYRLYPKAHAHIRNQRADFHHHDFLHQCRDVTQYFVDVFQQRQDFSADLAELATAHRGRDRFQITTRLAQALAKQAKELCRAAHANGHRKPE